MSPLKGSNNSKRKRKTNSKSGSKRRRSYDRDELIEVERFKIGNNRTQSNNSNGKRRSFSGSQGRSTLFHPSENSDHSSQKKKFGSGKYIYNGKKFREFPHDQIPIGKVKMNDKSKKMMKSYISDYNKEVLSQSRKSNRSSVRDSQSNTSYSKTLKSFRRKRSNSPRISYKNDKSGHFEDSDIQSQK